MRKPFLNPPKEIGDKLIYQCGRCSEEFESDVLRDLKGIEEYEDIFNIPFDEMDDADKMVICENCWTKAMRLN
jgi:DNA-directed RNA polymerase subunit RPC12/RpoP